LRNSIFGKSSAISVPWVLGGEVFVTFKPNLIDESNVVTDAGTLRILQSFIDQFAGLAARLTTYLPRSAPCPYGR